MTRRWMKTGILLLALGLPGMNADYAAFAQAGPQATRPGSANIAPEKLKAARDLLEATNADAQFTAIIPLMFRQMRQALPSAGPGQQEQVNQVFDEIQKQFIERRGEIIDQIVLLYASRFTAEEMNKLAEFYRTETGQKFIAAMPELAQQAMVVGNAWGQKIAREAEQKIREELQKRGLKL
ncbi:MAG: DUF2059 domain-containing protein [Rhodomicrobium sp.]|nr:DUF2059 domain-containing protein [Rhodomicrobium sp.]